MMRDRVLETRTRADGTRVRRYVRPDGSTYSTAEVPLEVWQVLKARSGARKGGDIKFARKYLEAIPRLQSSENARLLALEFGVSLSTIVRWRRKARASKKPPSPPPGKPPRELALQDVWLAKPSFRG